MPLPILSMELLYLSTASVHDVNVLDVISFEANSFYIMDRGYVDYKRLCKIHQCDAFFVTRTKDNMNYRRLYSHTVDKTKGVFCDQTIMLNGYYAAKDYPEKCAGAILISPSIVQNLEYWDEDLLYRLQRSAYALQRLRQSRFQQ